ncbi:serine hydrolase domain-containing protein [Croceitalea rosinachiae]|uniref:Serine hydrolase domain-containing protein n=1 Tax=Croceitalea rosinachiae TaxID=3075596 RepID=A0ABU3AGE6_9FLAO|nr:serine hydrolase domain-containing protein [Croceitalea sp. F388]MDT0607966.1 serine hydrolase domain-containing protein [Croceitalea sp. F388]
MKKRIISSILLACLATVSAQKKEFPKDKQVKVKAVLKKYVDIGIPGLALTVYNDETGFWSHAEGMANVEHKMPITPEHLFYLQSVSKTYMAVVILQLYEKGKLQLDDPITKYVNNEWLVSIKGADQITIKMLLNHTSGLPEYSTDPILVSKIIQEPKRVFDVSEMLSHIKDKPLEFKPGSNYNYRNTNYGMLSLIADKVTGDHVGYMKRSIFKKLDLDATVYLSKYNRENNLNIVDAYWDILLEGFPVNITKLQRSNVSSMKGDDGIVASTKDAVLFLKGLVSGKLLKPKTLELMQEFVLNDEGKKQYGLGIQYYDLDVTYALGHSGGGVGAGCVLLYLPELDSIVFMATNFNTMMESPIRKKAEDLQTDILMALFM